MAVRLPLFPLGLVLVPGQRLPLHVFEPRYRVLVEDLLAQPVAEQRFGVVAIRSGQEVGEDGVLALHEVGCTARLRRVEQHDDGRYDIVAGGAERFRLVGFEHDKPYLVGRVDLLPENPGEGDGPALAAAVRVAVGDYLRALAATGAGEAVVPELPADPRELGYLVTGGLRLDLDERQTLLQQPDDSARLRVALALLHRETQLLRTLSAVPAPELARTRPSPN